MVGMTGCCCWNLLGEKPGKLINTLLCAGGPCYTQPRMLIMLRSRLSEIKVEKKRAIVCKEKKDRISSLGIVEGETILVKSPASGSLGWCQAMGQGQRQVRTRWKILLRVLPHLSWFPRTGPYICFHHGSHTEKKVCAKD